MGDQKIITLPNDTRIALIEYGDPAGVPVVFCHGWPSSCTMAELTDQAAREVGVRIISPDRPGISGSAFQKDRKLLDWPPIVESMVDHLGIAVRHIDEKGVDRLLRDCAPHRQLRATRPVIPADPSLRPMSSR